MASAAKPGGWDLQSSFGVVGEQRVKLVAPRIVEGSTSFDSDRRRISLEAICEC